MLGLAVGEVLGLRRPYNGVRLGFMVNSGPRRGSRIYRVIYEKKR